MPLRHISIIPPFFEFPIYAKYSYAAEIQSRLQRQLLDWKSNQSTPPPAPTLISFTPAPTYTLGRRQTAPLSSEQLHELRRPLTLQGNERLFKPEVVNAPRGGLATYHGPGQIVFWPVIDLHSPLHAHLSVRDYACLLEKTTIATLAKYGAQGFTTENPGVWVRPRELTVDANDHEAKAPSCR